MPRRIQLRRTAGFRLRDISPNAVVCRRPCRYSNPYRVSLYGRAMANVLYRDHLRRHPEVVEAIRRDLAGRDLACTCSLDEECHVDTLLRVAAGGEP